MYHCILKTVAAAIRSSGAALELARCCLTKSTFVSPEFLKDTLSASWTSFHKEENLVQPCG